MRLLLNEKGRLTDKNEKSHIVYECELKNDYKMLNIKFEYSPKLLNDDNKAKEIIMDIIDTYTDGEENYFEKNNWERYKNLKNLVTLSFDDKNGFRGCVHRKDEYQDHTISKEEASPGIIPGIVPKGIFKIYISTHALVTEYCNYELSLYGEEI